MLNNIAALIGGAAPAVGDYESIQTFTLTSAQASVSFTGISSDYKHLQIRAISRTSAAEINLQLRANNDTGNSYAAHNLQGDGSSAGGFASSTPTNNMFLMRVAQSSNPANTFGAAVVDVLDYANTNKNKTFRSLTGYDANGSGYINFLSGLWMSTAAINRIDIYNAGGANLAANSSFALYGIK